MRVAPYQFFCQMVHYIAYVKLANLFSQCRNKNDLKQQISAFFTDVVPVFIFYCLYKFICLFNYIAPE